MADDRGGGEDNINDNMGNQLQLLPGNSQTHRKHRSVFYQLSVCLFIQLTCHQHVCTTGHSEITSRLTSFFTPLLSLSVRLIFKVTHEADAASAAVCVRDANSS